MKFITINEYADVPKTRMKYSVRIREDVSIHDACNWIEAQDLKSYVFGVSGLFVFWDEEPAMIFKLKFG